MKSGREFLGRVPARGIFMNYQSWQSSSRLWSFHSDALQVWRGPVNSTVTSRPLQPLRCGVPASHLVPACVTN